MSLNRYAPKRDSNEGAIRARLAHHGWHTETVSGKGMPDLLVWPKFYPIGHDGRRAVLVDVKGAAGQPTPAQTKKWAELATNGIPVYVARSEEDVDAIVSGKAEPWRPAGKARLKSAFRCPHGSECTHGCSG